MHRRFLSTGARRSAMPLLLLSAAVLCGGVPAGGQEEHVHNWTPGDAPSGSLLVTGENGLLSGVNPAKMCEILQIDGSSAYDADQCIAPGCSYPGGIALDGPPEYGVLTGTGGRFVTLNDDGTWKDITGPASPAVGSAPTAYFLVGPVQATNVSFSCKLVDAGTLADDPDVTVASDTIPVEPPAPGAAHCDARMYRDSPYAPACQVCEHYEPGMSEVSPATGNLRFSVPVTSWGYKGASLGFELTYNSAGDAQAAYQDRQTWHPAAISDDSTILHYNPKWTHSYAQFVEPLGDTTFVWHRGDGSKMIFGGAGVEPFLGDGYRTYPGLCTRHF